jgi:aminoglycoside phosphotransferase (APT) family kinase protein
MEPDAFNPNEHRTACERYLSRILRGKVRLMHAELLMKSTRNAPWRLDVEIEGTRRSYVLRLDSRSSDHEYAVLRAMEAVPLPTPRAYGWDPDGEALGVPCFFHDFIEGQSLKEPMLAAESWAEDLYLDTVCALQEISRKQLASIEDRLQEEETAETYLASAYDHFKTDPHPLADQVYARLRDSMPEAPAARFSNGDLWLDNIIVRDGRLAGVIDFENAGFSDPIYEFLLPFFNSPELRGRGIEERYCRRMGFDPGVLTWYHGLELFDTWHWVAATGKPFEQYTSEVLQETLERWLAKNDAKR